MPAAPSAVCVFGNSLSCVHFASEPVYAGNTIACEILKYFFSAVELYRFFYNCIYNNNVA